MCVASKMVRLVAVAVALAIASGPVGAVSDATGQPIITKDQREPAKQPSSPIPQTTQPAPIESPSKDETSAPAGLSVEGLCKQIGASALQNDLPAEFLAALIWQESRFDSSSISRAGAQGIAQFMPATARSRKLGDPFEPVQALHEAGRLLNELRTEFGNLGLAAAAYNAGAHRVHEWLAGIRRLPGETRAYVQAVTGRSVEEWAGSKVSDVAALPAESNPCSEMSGNISERQPRLTAHQAESVHRTSVVGENVSAPWGLQLIGDSSEVRALSAYRALQERFPKILGHRDPLVLRTSAKGPASWYRVRVAETSLQRANELCERLKSAGGNCLVQRNQ